MIFSDAHIHIAEISHWQPFEGNDSFLPVCASAHSQEDFLRVEELLGSKNLCKKTFGIHPQAPSTELLPFLETLIKEKRISAIGECGFDFFPEFASSAEEQKTVWKLQLDLALKNSLPLVIHCRKALPQIFAYSAELKTLPSVIFHSWAGSSIEATALLQRGVNAFFVIGKQVLNGNKRVIQSASQLPLDRILCETDAPYQTLKNETESLASDIKDVYRKVSELRQISPEILTSEVLKNFERAFSAN